MSTGLTTQTNNGMAHPPVEASFGQLVSMGVSLLKTGFLPSHIKSGEAFAAIVLMGREMGMSTMAACRKLQCIKGTVTERADSQLARFKTAGGRAEFKELSETKAVLVLKHPNGDQHTETFTIDDAKRAGLASNDNYAKHPKAMLRSRAITAGLKSIGWEGAVGIYDPDEVEDIPTPEPAREPVVVRPKFEPTPEPEERANPYELAKELIAATNEIPKLAAMRTRIDQRLREGVLKPFEADELLDSIHAKVEFLEAQNEVAA
jgi:hypothetical protein